MSLVELDDKKALAEFFAADPALHIYELGDLDPFFWPDTRWFGWHNQKVSAIALLYSGGGFHTLLCFERNNVDAARSLLTAVSPNLPATFYAHISPGLDTALTGYQLSSHGVHLKMQLGDLRTVEGIDAEGMRVIHPDDLGALQAFYERSYPGNWFVPRMLETGQYVGAYEDAELRAVAGVHVYSPDYRVAALGNITTAPEHRGLGLGRATTARLCQSLLKTVDTIGLNVKADNEPAIRCYQSLGFEPVAEYEEFAASIASAT